MCVQATGLMRWLVGSTPGSLDKKHAQRISFHLQTNVSRMFDRLKWGHH
jgi:hypothetical protein